MNIQQLEYLIAVDRHKHFGKAAQACFITQPTLSAMIHKFEEELDVKIFDRTTHPIRTTDVGVHLIEEAKKVISSVNELKNKANLLNNILAGTLNLGIIPTVSSFLLPSQIFDFLNENPKIELDVKEMTTENIIKSLRSGAMDAGIISTPYRAAEDFHQEFLFNEELLLYSSDKTGAEETFINPDDLDTDKMWLLEEGNCLKTQTEKICHLKENSLKPKNLQFLAANIHTLVQMVDKVGGITVLPELAVPNLTPDQQEKVSRFRKPFPYREISLIYYKPTYKQRILSEMTAYIKNSVSEKLNFHENPEDFVSIRPQ